MRPRGRGPAGRDRLGRLAGALGLLSAAGLATALAAVQPAPVDLAASRTSVRPGEAITLTADHLPAGQVGTIRLEGADITAGAFRADGSGVARVRVRIPDGLAPGVHVVSLCWAGGCVAVSVAVLPPVGRPPTALSLSPSASAWAPPSSSPAASASPAATAWPRPSQAPRPAPRPRPSAPATAAPTPAGSTGPTPAATTGPTPAGSAAPAPAPTFDGVVPTALPPTALPPTVGASSSR